jgi:hypothetical protein
MKDNVAYERAPTRPTAAQKPDYRLQFRNTCPTLLHELDRARRRARHGASAPYLRSAGVADLLALPDYPPWGLDWISVGEEFYQTEPYPDGIGALIVPAIELLHVVDLVAVSLETGALRTRYGIAEYIGHNALDDRSADGEPVPVFEDALSWLRGGGDGIFIVDWTHIHSRLQGLPGLVCQTPALAQRIKRAFEQAVPCPPLLVASDQKESRHAA